MDHQGLLAFRACKVIVLCIHNFYVHMLHNIIK